MIYLRLNAVDIIECPHLISSFCTCSSPIGQTLVEKTSMIKIYMHGSFNYLLCKISMGIESIISHFLYVYKVILIPEIDKFFTQFVASLMFAIVFDVKDTSS